MHLYMLNYKLTPLALLTIEDVWKLLIAWGRFHAGLSSVDTLEATELCHGLVEDAVYSGFLEP